MSSSTVVPIDLGTIVVIVPSYRHQTQLSRPTSFAVAQTLPCAVRVSLSSGSQTSCRRSSAPPVLFLPEPITDQATLDRVTLPSSSSSSWVVLLPVLPDRVPCFVQLSSEHPGSRPPVLVTRTSFPSSVHFLPSLLASSFVSLSQVLLPRRRQTLSSSGPAPARRARPRLCRRFSPGTACQGRQGLLCQPGQVVVRRRRQVTDQHRTARHRRRPYPSPTRRHPHRPSSGPGFPTPSPRTDCQDPAHPCPCQDPDPC